MAEWEQNIPSYWNDTERSLYENVLGGEPEIESDPQAQFMYHEALFDKELAPEYREQIYYAFIDYLWDEYGIDFEADFDWEAFREWYEGG